jgi:predicted DNA-binding transcriptional regulator AlpA
MQNLEIPTATDIRAAVRDELTTFFSTFQFQPPSDIDEIGGIELAVKITGLAKQTIYSLVSLRKIPYSKQTKKLYFSRAELLQWLKSGKRKTQLELALDAENFPNPKQSKTTVAAR